MYDANEKTNAPKGNRAEAFVSFFVQYCLHHFFKSKREMSKELGIGYQSILLVTNTPEKYKGASLVFQELVVYCIRKGVSMDEIAEAFLHVSNAEAKIKEYALQAPGFYMHCPHFEEYDLVLSLEKEESLLAKAHLFMFHLRVIYCKDCMCFWNGTTSKECLIDQTLAFLVKKLQE